MMAGFRMWDIGFKVRPPPLGSSAAKIPFVYSLDIEKGDPNSEKCSNRSLSKYNPHNSERMLVSTDPAIIDTSTKESAIRPLNI